MAIRVMGATRKAWIEFCPQDSQREPFPGKEKGTFFGGVEESGVGVLDTYFF